MLYSADGPRSIKEFNSKITALAESSASGELGNNLAAPVNDDPLHIHADACDLLPQSDAEYLVVEIVDSSKHSVGLIARAMSEPSNLPMVQPATEPSKGGAGKADKGGIKQNSKKPAEAARQEGGTSSAKDAASHSGRVNGVSQEGAESAEESKDSEGVTDLEEEEDKGIEGGVLMGLEEAEQEMKITKKIWNATSRRRGAFRRGLIRCVMLKHEAFLRSIGPEAAEFDSLKEGRWHEKFPVSSLSLAGLLKAAEEASEQLAESEASGRIKCVLQPDLLHIMQTHPSIP